MTICDHIANRVAAGEQLNDDQQSHADLCSACSAALDATRTLSAIGKARADVTPGPGFSARVASRAWERVGQRKRQRVVGYALATSGAIAAAALAFTLFTGDRQSPHITENTPLPAAMQPVADDVDIADIDSGDAETARDLVWLTDADRALSQSANWEFIEEPVAPYALLLDESALEENDQ